MPNPNGNPAGKPPSDLTLEHGRREKIDMRWPEGITARVDRRAAELTLEEGRVVTRTEYALRAVVARLEEDAVPPAEREKNKAMAAASRAAAARREKAHQAGVAEVVAEQEGCPHPKDARMQLGYMTRCGICGKRTDQ